MPHIIQRSTFKDTLNDILHVLGKVQIGRIGIPKQIRGEIFETLSPRGVCSRIPHLRHFRRAHHGLFFAHVYARIIPYLVTSGLPSCDSCGRQVILCFTAPSGLNGVLPHCRKNVDNLRGRRRNARPLRAGRAAGRSRAGGP